MRFRLNSRYRLLLTAGLAVFFVAAWPWLASPSPEPTASTLWVLAASALLQFAVWLALVALTGRPIGSLFGLAVILGVLLLVNGLTYRYNGVAMLPIDVVAVVGILRDFDLFRLYVVDHWLAGVGLVGLLALLICSAVRERPLAPWTRRNAIVRLAVVAGTIALFLPPTTGSSPAYRLLVAAGAKFTGQEANRSVARNGLFAHLVTGLPELVVDLPVDHGDPAVLERALARVSAPDYAAPGGHPPHIVVILEESFFDPRELDVAFDPPILTRFDAVAARSRYHGLMHVAVVGGGTVESEFSFLTGLSTNPFHQAGRWPFQTIVTDASWSIARYLDSLGYDTVGLYPHPGSLFGGQAAYRKMGFNRLLDVSAFEPTRDFAGPYVKDEAVSRKVVEIIKSATKPTFIMALTMQNHGPWGARPDGAKSPYRVKGNLTAENRAMLEDYVTRLADVETLVERTDAELRSLGVPIVFALFGDHLPALFSVFREVGFRRPGESTDHAPSSTLWFRTPYFISTYPPSGEPEALNTDVAFLASMVLDVAGMNQDAFFRRASAFRRLCEGRFWSCGPRDELSRAYVQTLYDRVREEWRTAAAAGGGAVTGAPYQFGRPIIPGTEWLGAGWASEAWGAWTVGRDATVVLRLNRRVNMPLAVVARIASSDPIREVEVLVNGRPVTVWHLDPDAGPAEHDVLVPISALEDSRTMIVTFRTAEPRSPRELTGRPDDRHLGLAFRALTVCVPGWQGCPVPAGASSPGR